MAPALSPRPTYPFVYSQSYSNDNLKVNNKPPDSGHDRFDSHAPSGRLSRRNLFALPSILNSNPRLGLRQVNSNPKVQHLRYTTKQPRLTPSFTLKTYACQWVNMEQSLTPKPSRSTFQRHLPPAQQVPLLTSPSAPNLSLRQTLKSYSTPNLRQQGEKKSALGNIFKGGFKSLFRRGPLKPSGRGVDISLPLEHHAAPMDTDQSALSFKEMMADHEYEAFAASKMNNVSVASQLEAASPSPPMIEQTESKSENKGDGMTPAEREAARLGLEIDFSRPDPLLLSENLVRAYKDLGSDFYAARDAGPIYDGNAVSSGTTSATVNDASDSIGTWRCCKCDQKQELYQHDQGQHIVSALNCACPHKSCENCTLTGNIKLYQPVQEPIPVQLSDDEHKQVKFGVFCSNCGLSWRAQIVKDTVLQKISAVPKDLAKRTAHPLDMLRESKSMSNLRGDHGFKTSSVPTKSSTLNLRQLSSEMAKEHGKQANSVMVKFSGIQCTCGRTVDASSLCFQIVEPSKKEVTAPETIVVEPSFTATSEDQARGIGKSTLALKGRRIRHANPLMSNPVTDDDLAMMAMFK